LPDLFAAGVSSFKIEGRVKSAFYVATIVKIYREALKYINNKEEFDKHVPFFLEELKKVSHRNYTEGFYSSKPNHNEQKYETSSYTRTHEFVGLVLQYLPQEGMALLEQRNNFKVGDELEIFGPNTDFRKFVLKDMYDETFTEIQVAPHPQQKIYIKIPFLTESYALLRRQGK
jgi:putative protease